MSTAPITLDAVAAKLDALIDRLSGAGAQPRFIGVAGAAMYTGLSPESIRGLLSAGRLTALRPVRGRVLIDRDELDRLILSSAHQLRSGRGRRNRQPKTQVSSVEI